MNPDNQITFGEIFTTKKILGLQIMIFCLCVALDLILFFNADNSVTHFIFLDLGILLWGGIGILSKKLIIGNGLSWWEYSGVPAVINGGVMVFMGIIALIFTVLLSSFLFK